MKGIKAILGFALATTGIGGAVAVGATSLSNAENNRIEVAEAATGMKTFLLDCTSFNGWDSESICIGTWNGSVNTYTEATKVAEDYWTVTIDTTGLSGVEFYRCAAGKAQDKDSRWNKSSWNTNCVNNLCKITGWDESSTWSTVNGADETYEVASTTPSASTKRIWMDPKDNFYDGNARAGLRIFGTNVTEKIFILGGSSQFVNMTHEGKSQTFFYVDIPVNADCQLVRLHNALNYIWTYSGNFSNIDGYNPTLIVYSWNASAELSAAGIDSNSNYTVDYAKKVLDGYNNCEDSDINGCGAYSQIKSNILDKLGSSKLSTLRAATFSSGGHTYTYGQKIDGLSNGVSSSSRNFVITANSNSSFIVVVSAVSALSLVALCFFFLRKKHQ